MTWRWDVNAQAESLERAGSEPLSLFDENTQSLIRTARTLRPSIQQSERRRAEIKARAFAAFDAAHAGQDTTPRAALPEPVESDITATSLLHPTFGRVVVSDVEGIDAERAQRIADRLEQVVGESARQVRGER